MTLTVDQAISAILALINSRPTSPTKDEIASIVARVQAPAPSPCSRSTALGRDLLQHIAAAAKAVAAAKAKGQDIEDCQDAEDCLDRADAAIDVILARPARSPEHLVDLAIVARFRGDGEVYDLADVDEAGDADAAHVRIVRFLLKAAGIPEVACSVDGSV
jgi:hypothetical protein